MALLEDQPAPNRYRAALSSFGKYLVEREVLETNPVRDVQSAKEHPPRLRVLDRYEAQKLVAAIEPLEARAIHALMCGSGMEVGAALALRHRDVDLTAMAVHAHGTKTAHRDRAIRVTEEWCWPVLRAWIDAQLALPDAKVFSLTYKGLTSALRSACKAAGIDNYRSHDWRHTYAVQARRDGYSDQVIAHQLGHRNTVMVQTVYGRYSPKDADYVHSQTVGLTVGVNNASKTAKKVAAR